MLAHSNTVPIQLKGRLLTITKQNYSSVALLLSETKQNDVETCGRSNFWEKVSDLVRWTIFLKATLLIIVKCTGEFVLNCLEIPQAKTYE